MSLRSVVFLTCLLSSPAGLLGWDYEGHRAVNQVAIAALPAAFPDFVRAPQARERLGFLAGEPDRWRNSPDLPLQHLNNTDHYIDFEDLDRVELKPEQLSEFRHVFAGQVAIALHEHPERFPGLQPEKNRDHTREQIGFLPWAITENYGKLKSAFSYLKAYEEAGTPEEIANAKANILYLMGVMGHYVGDGAQPLHTTRHHNGWVGDNPRGYTTWNKFHSWIDGGFLRKTGGVPHDDLVTGVKPARLLDTRSAAGERDPIFSEVMEYLTDQYARVTPLYELEKAGHLNAEGTTTAKGRAFLEGQLLRAAHMLASLWYTAWRDAPRDNFLLSALQERKLRAESQ